MKSVSLSLAVVLILTVATMEPVKCFDCVKAKLSLTPCVPFLTTNVQSPATACCNALSDLKASVHTKPEIRAACECLVATAKDFPNLNKDKAVQLPRLCNIVNVDFPITKEFDCSM